MSESDQHRWLVASLLRVWEADSTGWRFVSADGVPGPSCPAIAGHRPDAFQLHRAGKYVRIGEAKTASDVERQHTNEQLCAYFDYLRCFTSGELHLAVPWVAADSMYFAARACRRRVGATGVAFIVQGWVPSRAHPVLVSRG